MAYIRIKKISNKPYAYLVESRATKKGPRQKVKQYLGRVHTLEQKSEMKENINVTNKKEFLKMSVLRELANVGFKKNEKKFTFQKLIFCPQKLTLKKQNEKEAIIKLNEGFLCSFTLNRLKRFKKTDDLNKDAHMLAKYFVEAGISISQEEFITFYSFEK